MAEQYIQLIRTIDGDKQIDYNALANLPNIDANNLNILNQAKTYTDEEIANLKLVSDDLGGGSFIINFDFQNMTADKTFQEIQDAIISNKAIYLRIQSPEEYTMFINSELYAYMSDTVISFSVYSLSGSGDTLISVSSENVWDVTIQSGVTELVYQAAQEQGYTGSLESVFYADLAEVLNNKNSVESPFVFNIDYNFSTNEATIDATYEEIFLAIQEGKNIYGFLNNGLIMTFSEIKGSNGALVFSRIEQDQYSQFKISIMIDENNLVDVSTQYSFNDNVYLSYDEDTQTYSINVDFEEVLSVFTDVSSIGGKFNISLQDNDDIVFPLFSISESKIIFENTYNLEGTVHAVSYVWTPDNQVLRYEKILEGTLGEGSVSTSEIFVVNFTLAEDGTYSADKTFVEVQTALNADKNIIGKYYNDAMFYYYTPIVKENEAIRFLRFDGDISTIFSLLSDNTLNFEIISKSEVEKFIINISESEEVYTADKTFAQIQEAYNQGSDVEVFYNGYRYCLSYNNNDMFAFTNTFVDNVTIDVGSRTSYIVIGNDFVSEVKAELCVVYNSNDKTLSHTFDEITDALDVGTEVKLFAFGFFLDLGIVNNDKLVFEKTITLDFDENTNFFIENKLILTVDKNNVVEIFDFYPDPPKLIVEPHATEDNKLNYTFAEMQEALQMGRELEIRIPSGENGYIIVPFSGNHHDNAIMFENSVFNVRIVVLNDDTLIQEPINPELSPINVTLTYDSSTQKYTSNRTFASLKESLNNGESVKVNCDGIELDLLFEETDSLEFEKVVSLPTGETVSLCVIIDSDDVIIVHDNCLHKNNMIVFITEDSSATSGFKANCTYEEIREYINLSYGFEIGIVYAGINIDTSLSCLCPCISVTETEITFDATHCIGHLIIIDSSGVRLQRNSVPAQIVYQEVSEMGYTGSLSDFYTDLAAIQGLAEFLANY